MVQPRHTRLRPVHKGAVSKHFAVTFAGTSAHGDSSAAVRPRTHEQPDISSNSTRVRIEPTPCFILFETWTLGMNLPHRGGLDDADISPPVIFKHGIIIFRSLFSPLRVLPSWKFYKRLKRRASRNGHLGIQLRVRGVELGRSILGFDERLSPT